MLELILAIIIGVCYKQWLVRRELDDVERQWDFGVSLSEADASE